MKWIFPSLLCFGLALPLSVRANECRKQIDCNEGCETESGPFLCLPIGRIKFQEGEKKCARPFGGLQCGCKEKRCLYGVPQAFAGEDREKESCAKEGMTAGGSTLNALSCCPGLVATNRWSFEHAKEGCNIPPPPGSGGSCVKCGDGKCDTKNFEDKCVCPKDCR